MLRFSILQCFTVDISQTDRVCRRVLKDGSLRLLSGHKVEDASLFDIAVFHSGYLICR